MWPVILDLEITSDPETLLDNVKHILATIQDHKVLDLPAQRRVKLILVELITNSIKHAESKWINFQIRIDEPQLCIEKLEKGLHITFSSDTPQLPFDNIKDIRKINFSEMNHHQIQPLDEYKFRFLNPYEQENLDIEHMPEHFGLYIITMASDSFIYEYDPKLNENKYTVNLNI